MVNQPATSPTRVTGATPAPSLSHAPHDSLLQIVWRRKWIVVAAAIVALIGAFAYLSVTPKVYTSTSRILVQRVSSSLSAERGSSDADDTYLQTQCEVIKSTNVIAAALGTLDTRGLKTFANTSRPSTSLKRRIGAEVGKKDKIITVILSSEYKDEANKIVDAIVQAYKSYTDTSAQQGATSVVGILDKQKQKAQDELAKVQQDELALLKSANTLSFDSEKENYVRQRLSKLSDELTQAHFDTMKTREALESACRMLGLDPDQPDPQNDSVPLANQDEELFRAELFAAKQRLAEQRRSYGPSHPRVKEQAGRVEQLERAYAGSARARWRAAVTREQELQHSFDDQQKAAIEQSATATRYSQLQAQEKRLATQCDSLDAQIRQAVLSGNAGALAVTVLDAAQYEFNPVGPNVNNILAGAGLMGILLGCGLSLVREWSDPKIRNAAEVKSALGLPVLGAIPVVGGNRSRQALGWAVHLDPGSEAAESYRSLRTSIQLGIHGAKARTLVVSSASPSEGKSTLTSNLAIALAEGGRRVLLIDGDLRNPSQALIFGLSGAVGLSSILAAGEMVDGAIRRTTLANLHVMPAGPKVNNPSELLNRPSLNEILELLGQRYDHVVIDSPPIGRADDARILAASVDGAILVVRAEWSNRRHVEDARDALLSVGARVLGVVLNGSRSGSLGGYGYGYGAYGGNGGARIAEPPTADGNGAHAPQRVESKPRRTAPTMEHQDRVLADDGIEPAAGAL